MTNYLSLTFGNKEMSISFNLFIINFTYSSLLFIVYLFKCIHSEYLQCYYELINI